MLSRYGFCDKAEPVGIECLRWESRRGEKSALRVERRCTDGRVSLPAHRFQALYVRIVEQHGARSTEQRYKKRVITSVERRIVCFSVGSPLQRHLPTTKWAVHPNPSAKLRNPETITKSNRKNFPFHQNSFERYDNTSRRLAPKTRLLSRKNRDLLNKTPLLYSPTPHPTALPTRPRPLLPLYARIRALCEFSFFAFTLHHPR